MASELDHRLRDAQQRADARRDQRQRRQEQREARLLERALQRRAARRPRLVFLEDQDGFVLFGEGAWWRGPVLASAAVLWFLCAQATTDMLGLWAWVVSLPTIGLALWPVLAYASPTLRFRVMRDGRMAVLDTRDAIRFVGTRDQLRAAYDGGEGRIVISAQDLQVDLSTVGDADAETLRAYCAAAGVALDLDPGSREELVAMEAEELRIFSVAVGMAVVVVFSMLTFRFLIE